MKHVIPRQVNNLGQRTPVDTDEPVKSPLWRLPIEEISRKSVKGVRNLKMYNKLLKVYQWKHLLLYDKLFWIGLKLYDNDNKLALHAP